MKRKLIQFFLIVFTIGSFPLQAQNNETLNILFIGNSFTARHNVNHLVEEIIREGKPGLDIYTQKIIYGGQSLFQHKEYYFSQTFIEQSTITDTEINRRIAAMDSLLNITETPQEYIHFWENIRQKPIREFPEKLINIAILRHKKLLKKNPRTKWDYVVLQSWDDLTTDLNDGYGKYARELGEIARAQGAKVIFYMTAPDIQNQEPVAEPVKQKKFESEMSIMLELSHLFKPFKVIPVPLAINDIQHEGTDLTFRYVNDFHPNQRTAFLTANMFYAALFNESTEGFLFNTVTETYKGNKAEPGKDPDGGSLTVVFDEEDKLYLQKIAYKAIVDFQNQLNSNH